jgi:hypothetical protein
MDKIKLEDVADKVIMHNGDTGIQNIIKDSGFSFGPFTIVLAVLGAIAL